MLDSNDLPKDFGDDFFELGDILLLLWTNN